MTDSLSINPFHVDVSSFYYPPDDKNNVSASQQKEKSLSDSSDSSKDYHLKTWEKWNFSAHEVNKDRLEQNTSLEKKAQQWKTAERVFFVGSKVISIIFPLVICYCPVWVPWGIVLPMMIVLGIVQYKIKKRAELYEIYKQHDPLIKEFLKKDLSLKHFSPIGPWQLSELDDRLKSDKMMKERVGEKYLKSAEESVDLIAHLDLEWSFLLGQYVADKLTGVGAVEKEWKSIHKKVSEAKAALRKGDLTGYLKLQAEARKNEPPECEFPPSSMRSTLQKVIWHHAALCHLYSEVDELLKQENELYSQTDVDYHTLKLPNQIFKRQLHVYKLAWEMKAQLEPIISLLTEKPPDELLEKDLSEEQKAELQAFINDWEFRFYKALLFVKENQLEITLTYLIDEMHRIKKNLESWIEKHPHERIKVFKKNMRELDERILNQKSLKMLAKWIKEDGSRRNLSFVTLPEETRDFWKKRDFPKEVRQWLSRHKKMCRYSPLELLNSKKIQSMDSKTITLLKKWVKAHPILSQQQSCQEVMEEMRLATCMMSCFNKDSSMQFETFSEIVEQSVKLRAAFKQAYNNLEELRDAETKIYKPASNEIEEGASVEPLADYNELCKNLDKFEKTLSKLCNLYAGEPFSLKTKTWVKKFFSIGHTLPFDTILPDDQPLRARKFQEYRLNQLLQERDIKMLYIGRIALTGIPVMSYLIIAVQAIFSYFAMSSWFFWGFSAINVLLSSGAYYLNHLLKKEEKKKEALKIHLDLLDHPGVGIYPGTCPAIAELKHLEGKLGLDGVERTVSVAIIEGKNALPIPNGKESAKKMMAGYAKEGSNRARRYLENRLVTLKSQYHTYGSVEEKIKKGVKKARKIEALKEELLSHERLEMLDREITILHSQCAYQQELGNDEKADALNQRLRELEEKKAEQEENMRDVDEIMNELNLQKERYKQISPPVKKGIKTFLLIEEIETSLGRTPVTPKVSAKTQEMREEIQQKKLRSEKDAIEDQIRIEKIKQYQYKKLLKEMQQLRKGIEELHAQAGELKEKIHYIALALQHEDLLEAKEILMSEEQICTEEMRDHLDQRFEEVRDIFNSDSADVSIERVHAMINSIKEDEDYHISVFQDYYLYYQYQIELNISTLRYKERRWKNILKIEKLSAASPEAQIEQKIQEYDNEINSLKSKKSKIENRLKPSLRYSIDSSSASYKELSEDHSLDHSADLFSESAS